MVPSSRTITRLGRSGRPGLFTGGVLLVTVGVGLHLVEFVQMRAMGAHGGSLGPLGMVGMATDLLGLVLATIGILPQGWRTMLRRRRTDVGMDGDGGQAKVLAAMDASRLTGKHWRLVALLYVALALDTMKPATIAFQLPGLKAEYHLVPAQASLIPLFALIGTTVGSVLFGFLVDLVGRRTSFVLTALVIAATSICGLMPAFPFQLGMCFVMGIAAGGVLPVVYTLMAETMPARHRGWLSVTLGGVGGLSGFLLASLAAVVLEPTFSWRVLWLPNLPTSLIILVLLRWIPESPRFLLQWGQAEAAREAMAQVGAVPAAVAGAGVVSGGSSVRTVFGGRLRNNTLILCMYGFSWGLCNWGVVVWLPTILRGLGQDAAFANGLLAKAAFFALPGTLVAAALYGLWSSRWAAALFAMATGCALSIFGLAQPALAARPELITVAVVGLLIASNSMAGIIAPYSAENYPTRLRGVGSGVVAASTKAGGVVGPTMVGVLLTLSTGLALPALIVSVPLGLASILVAWRGTESRGRRLEELEAMAVS